MSQPRQKLMIAIDGGAGTGTSSAAKGVAKVMGIPHLNTGELYRGITYAVLKAEANPENEAEVAAIAEKIEFGMEVGDVVTVNGEDVRGKLHLEPVNRLVSLVASHRRGRDAIMDFQRQFAHEHGVVMEGRDIGTRILPDATLKFFFVCDPQERVRRVNLGGRSHETVETLLERDELDATRKKVGAFKQAPDAEVIDTTHLNIEQVVGKIVDAAKAAGFAPKT